jgi:hypothetical protein
MDPKIIAAQAHNDQAAAEIIDDVAALFKEHGQKAQDALQLAIADLQKPLPAARPQRLVQQLRNAVLVLGFLRVQEEQVRRLEDGTVSCRCDGTEIKRLDYPTEDRSAGSAPAPE